MLRWKRAVDNFPDFGLTFGNPDFVRYAEANDAHGSRVGATERLIATLKVAFKQGGVHLVVSPIDYSENTRLLVDELCAQLSFHRTDLRSIPHEDPVVDLRHRFWCRSRSTWLQAGRARRAAMAATFERWRCLVQT